MSLKNKLTKLFGKKESKHQLGVSLRQDAFAFCFVSEAGEYQFHQQPVVGDDVSSALEKLLKHDSIQGQAQLILAPSQYQIVQVEKPNIPESELLSALKWQVKDLVTASPDNMILDYFSGPVVGTGAEKVHVVCAQKSVLQGLVDQFDDSNAILTCISTEEFAFASLVPKQEHACLLVCQQPNEELLILIVKNGRLYFHRRLRGFAQIGSKTPEELSFGTIDSLSLEIQRSTDYFERQLKQAPIRDIQLILPIKTEAYLATKLAENTNTPVSAFTLPEQIAEQKMYAAAIGATRLNNMESS